MKKIGIMTTGGDCSGLNSVIFRLVQGGIARGYKMIGILDGTDGLVSKTEDYIELDSNVIGAASARLSGSILRNGKPGALSYRTDNKTGEFQKKLKKAIERLNLDAVILIGGNGSVSLSYKYPDVYSSVQLICIPKTIDMDIPLTDTTIGFDTAVDGLARYADQLLLTARSHHRWFVVQTMGRDSGFLCLHGGIAAGASAILIPEIKWKMPDLIKHVKSQSDDYGLIFVAEGCKMRGRSGHIADIIVRDMTAVGILSRAEFPEHLQRSGDTVASDRILAAEFAEAAFSAIDNNETFVMATKQGNVVKTIAISEVIKNGVQALDPVVHNVFVSNEYVSMDNPLIKVAAGNGIFMG